MIAYLAGAIDLVSNEDRKNWRENAKITLNEYGITTIDPTGTFSYVKSGIPIDDRMTSADLIKINEFNMEMSDVVLMVLSKDKPSIGTPIELYMCYEKGKDVVVYWDGDMDFIPAYIHGLVPYDRIFGSYDRAINTVIGICIGKRSEAEVEAKEHGIR